jgi:BMFP domain-containing protein YqiC
MCPAKFERTEAVRAFHASARSWCGNGVLPSALMIDSRLLDDLRTRIEAALRDSPAQDIERNLRALLASWFDRLDLVLREDFEVQKKLLERAQARLAELETRVAELETSRSR